MCAAAGVGNAGLSPQPGVQGGIATREPVQPRAQQAPCQRVGRHPCRAHARRRRVTSCGALVSQLAVGGVRLPSAPAARAKAAHCLKCRMQARCRGGGGGCSGGGRLSVTQPRLARRVCFVFIRVWCSGVAGLRLARASRVCILIRVLIRVDSCVLVLKRPSVSRRWLLRPLVSKTALVRHISCPSGAYSPLELRPPPPPL